MDKSKEHARVSRRDFLPAAGAYTTAAAVAGGLAQTRAFGQTPVGANDVIHVGVIGCGGRGRHHINELLAMKEMGEPVEVTAVCDVYRPRMDASAEKTGAKGFMNHHELLNDANVDVVCIATPDHIHGYQAIDAVEAGKDVYCEKPFTHWRQFVLNKRAVEAVHRTGRKFQLGTQGMSDPAWHEARKKVEEGLIGQVLHAECGYFRVGDWGERGMPIDDPNAQPGADLDWEAFLGDAPKRDFDVSRFFRWRMYEDYSGGPVTDLFPHTLTPVVFMLGLDFPVRAMGSGGKFRYEEREVPDTFNLLADYPENATIAVLGTQGNNYQGCAERGSGGRCPALRGWDGTLTFEGNEIVFTPAEGSHKDYQRFAFDGNESVKAHWKNLFDCCRNGGTPESPVDLGHAVQTTLQMAALSLRHNTIARFDEERMQIVL